LSELVRKELAFFIRATRREIKEETRRVFEREIRSRIKEVDAQMN
jgi:hypothetical protein